MRGSGAMYSKTVYGSTMTLPEGERADGTARFDASGDSGDMPDWSELVAQHADRVYRLAFRLCGNAHDAQDITQEAFIRGFRSPDRYQPGTLEGRTHPLVPNLFLDQARRRARIRFAGLPEGSASAPG